MSGEPALLGSERAADRRPLIVLALLGGVLFLAYLLLTILYPLGALYSNVIPNAIESKPAWRLIEGGIIAIDKPLYVAAMIGVHLVYLGAFVYALRRSETIVEKSESSKAIAGLILVIGAACAIVLLWSYPLFSQDVFDYIFHTHEWVRYGASPFTHTPSQFSLDPLYPYVSWTAAPSPYGPLWLYLTAPLSWLAGGDLFTNLVLFKGLTVACYIGSAIFLYLTLDKTLPRFKVAGTLLFAWNPLVLMEFGTSGHNDIVMIFFAILAAWFVANGRFAIGLVALTASILVKIVTIFIFPIFIAYVWRRLAHQMRRSNAPPVPTLGLRYSPTGALQGPIYRLAGYFTLAAAVVVLSYAPVWEGFSSMAFLRRGDIVGGAPVGNVVTGLIESVGLGRDTAANFWRLLAWGSFGLFIIRQAWIVLRGGHHTFADLPGVRLLNSGLVWLTDRREPRKASQINNRATRDREPDAETETERLFRASMSIMLFYAVVVSQYYQPWYLSWALVWAGMLLRPPYRLMLWTIVIFSAVAVVGYMYL